MKKIAIAALGSMVLMSGGAYAADLLPQTAPPPEAYVAPADTAYDWSGFYLGVNGGYGAGTLNVNSPGTTGVPATSDSFNANGWMGGVTAGYNVDLGNNFVVGVEADLDKTNLQGTSDVLTPTDSQVNASIDWLGTVRARAGFAADKFLIYGTGGLAMGGLTGNVSNFPHDGNTTSVSDTQTGWTVGAGIETALTDNISLKAEYMYVDLGNKDYNLGDDGTGNSQNYVATVHPTANIVRAGLNFKF